MYLVIMIIKIIIILYLNIIMMYLLIITYMSIDVRIILSAATKYYGNDDDVQYSSFVEARVSMQWSKVISVNFPVSE